MASKHAVEGLTKSAALEAAASGVRSQRGRPGPIETGMLNRFTGTDERKAGLIAGVPLKRVGRPEEIAQTIVFLASDKASFITGARHRRRRWQVGIVIRSSSEGSHFCRTQENEMNQTIESKNKALVLEAFDTLFNKRDYVAAERYWSPDYIQHSAHIAPGREGLFNLIKSIPPTLKYEPGTIVAEGDFVIVHGRFSGFGQPVNWIAADILRIKDGILVEHWDVIQDEATQEQSKSGLPMFGDAFPK